MHGQGTKTFISGEAYEGQFEHDEMSGYGTYTCLDKTVYKGGFLADDFEGFGTKTDANGDVLYEGQWHAGKPANS